LQAMGKSMLSGDGITLAVLHAADGLYPVASRKPIGL